MQQQEQPSGQVQTGGEKQKKEEKIIRLFSLKNIVLGNIVVAFFCVLFTILYVDESIIRNLPLVFLSLLQYYFFILIIAGIVLMIISMGLYFSSLKKAAKKVFLKGVLITLIFIALYGLSMYVQTEIFGIVPVGPYEDY